VNRILIDAKGIQAYQHLLGEGEAKQRLTSFVELLESIDAEVVFSNHIRDGIFGLPRLLQIIFSVIAYYLPVVRKNIQKPIVIEDLDGFDLLVVTTRSRLFPYTEVEIDAIEHFVHKGGALLLMANHGAVPGKAPDLATEDSRLASRFGVKIIDACFHIPNNRVDLKVCSHELSSATIRINNCCAISQESVASSIARLDSRMIDMTPSNYCVENMIYGVTSTEYKGRIAVLGDSGLVGEPAVPAIGPGLIDEKDNSRFIRGLVLWLLRSPAAT